MRIKIWEGEKAISPQKMHLKYRNVACSAFLEHQQYQKKLKSGH